jgi:hypothetical protein
MVLKPLRRLPPRRLHEAPARAQGRGEGTAPARRRASAEGGLCPKLPGVSQRRISLRKGIATGRSHFSRLTLPLTIKLDLEPGLEPGWAKTMLYFVDLGHRLCPFLRVVAGKRLPRSRPL